jgi:hypothetical protein
MRTALFDFASRIRPHSTPQAPFGVAKRGQTGEPGTFNDIFCVVVAAAADSIQPVSLRLEVRTLADGFIFSLVFPIEI